MSKENLVFGAIIGQQINRDVFLQGSFEAIFNKGEIDYAFLSKKAKMYT